jgi:hypothetical protein
MPRNVILACAVWLTSMSALAAPVADPWPFWQQSDAHGDQRVDHAPWQSLLDHYLTTTEDGRTLFRYAGVTADDRQRLDTYLEYLTDLDPRLLHRDEQFPYWINLYNALTVRVVLDHPDKQSIRQMGGGWFRSGPWRDKLVNIAGQPVSLDDIEHRILRPFWRDHRIHFAVNCASIGCPDLAPRAYTRDNVDELLDDGERRYLRHPRGVSMADGRLRLSSLFDWYRDDFAADRDGLLGYLAGHRPDLAAQLDGYTGAISYHYDWQLNAAP